MARTVSPLERFRPVSLVLVLGVGLGVGLGHGFLAEPDGIVANCTSAEQVTSSVLGWTYFAAWSVSFYPQVVLNWQRRSVSGFSLDYATLNVCGFACLSAFYLSLYCSDTVRKEYALAHDGKPPAVRLDDVFFALHALALSTTVYVQSLIYPRGGQRVSVLVQLALAALAPPRAIHVARIDATDALPRAEARRQAHRRHS